MDEEIVWFFYGLRGHERIKRVDQVAQWEFSTVLNKKIKKFRSLYTLNLFFCCDVICGHSLVGSNPRGPPVF